MKKPIDQMIADVKNPNDTRVDDLLLDRLADRRGRCLSHGLQTALRLLQLELDIDEACRAARQANQEHRPKDGLHIGSGRHRLEGYTNLDIFQTEVSDVVVDAREGLPFKSHTFKRIFSEHMLEHVDYPYSTLTILAEMYRVLEENGEIVLGVPDSEPVIRAYANNDEDFMSQLRKRWYGKRPATIAGLYNHAIDLVHLVGSDEQDSAKYAPHYWAFDEGKLRSLMEMVGFVDIKPWEFDASIANPDRQWNSVYLHARKSVDGEQA